uniref:Uncharacterized protein n=1 Tax=Arundo donax TaxID=35708 RepID=A0A0A8ZF45_ARUDO
MCDFCVSLIHNHVMIRYICIGKIDIVEQYMFYFCLLGRGDFQEFCRLVEPGMHFCMES